MKVCIVSSKRSAPVSAEAVASGFVMNILIKEPRLLSHVAYDLLYDPNLLAGLGAADVFELSDEMEAVRMHDADVIVIARRLSCEDEKEVLSCIAEGKKVFWVAPGAKALKEATGGDAVQLRELVSHEENWHLPGLTVKYFPACCYGCCEVSGEAEGDYTLGDWPSLIRHGGNAYWPGDPFCDYMSRWNTPEDMLGDGAYQNIFLGTMVMELGRVMGVAVEKEKAMARSFLRRDFHAYGFARHMVEDLAKLNGREICLQKADELLCCAAKAFCDGEADEAVEARLKPAFEELYAVRRSIIDIPIYYADAMHGGILTQDYGYIEIAQPEFVADLMRMFLTYSYRRKYHFSVDISIATFVHLNERHPSIIREFKKAMEDGVFEVANGSYGQPYPFLFTPEAAFRQFECGQEAMVKLFGQRATTLLAQEMQLVPTYPAILKQCGYTLALHRIQNKGATVYDDEVCVNWIGPDGESLKTIPTHYDDSQQSISTGFVLWPQLITETAKHYPMGIYTNLLDLVWITSFREEAIRAAYYAPVLGSFVTYKELEKMVQPTAERHYRRDDYLVELQPCSTVMLNDMNSSSQKLEGLESYAALHGRADAAPIVREGYDLLGEYENHDNTVCFQVRPRGRSGPYLYEVMQGQLRRKLAELEEKLGDANSLFNPVNRNRTLYLAKVGSEYLPAGRCDLSAAEGVAKVEMAPWQTVSFPCAAGEKKSCGCKTLDNGIVHAELDETTGALKVIVNGRDQGVANELTACVDGSARVTAWEKIVLDGVQQIKVKLDILRADGSLFGWAESFATLQPDSARIDFMARITSINNPPDPYAHYIKARQHGLFARFTPAEEYAAVRDCWLNQINDEMQPKEYGPGLYYGSREAEKKFLALPAEKKLQSYMGLILQGKTDAVLLHNAGSQIYEVEKGVVSNMLWGNGEYGDVACYAAEYACRPEEMYASMLDWQLPALAVPAAEAIASPTVSAPNVWISTVSQKNGKLRIRLIETEGRETVFALKPGAEYAAASLITILGEKIADADLAALTLKPYGIATVELG